MYALQTIKPVTAQKKSCSFFPDLTITAALGKAFPEEKICLQLIHLINSTEIKQKDHCSCADPFLPDLSCPCPFSFALSAEGGILGNVGEILLHL